MLDETEGRDPDGEFDALSVFMHDVPHAVCDEALARGVKDHLGRAVRQAVAAGRLAGGPD